jgi:glutamyl-tRNA reductase
MAPDEVTVLSRSLAGDTDEAVLLATCNRTEIYLAGANVAKARDQARLAFVEQGGAQLLCSGIYTYGDEQAGVHLFRVASGLESTVLGDTDVAAQVRRASAVARALGTAGPLLGHLFVAASMASKRVRSETSLSTGATSVPAAALAIAARVAAPLHQRRVLVVGAGGMATKAALNAVSRGCRELVVANRTVARGQELAARVGGRAASFDDLDAEIAAADVVVAATSARAFVLTAEHAARQRRSRGDRPLTVFDLALPRDVDPAFRELRGVNLFNLDDLACIVAASAAQRQAALEQADAIVQEEAQKYAVWCRRRAAVPAITALRAEAEDMRRAVLARHAGKLARLEAPEQLLVETITSQLVAKLLHTPTLELVSDAVHSLQTPLSLVPPPRSVLSTVARPVLEGDQGRRRDQAFD